ncbi:hypothetical protein BG004_006336, partial [Podila humilis]
MIRRKNHRAKVLPVEHWKNKRVVYEQSNTSPCAGGVIKAVIKAPKEIHEHEVEDPSGKDDIEMTPRKKAKTSSSRSEQKVQPKQKVETRTSDGDVTETMSTCDSRNIDNNDDQEETNSNFRLDFDFFVEGKVVDPMTGGFVVQTVNKDSMAKVEAVPKSGYLHRAGIVTGELASGIIKIEPGKKKPSRVSRDGSVTFFVTEGMVVVTINLTTFAVRTGGQFIVPRGNQYMIKNTGRNTSTLFYARVKGGTRDESSYAKEDLK